MLARHGSSLPDLGFRTVKSEKTNLPVDLSGEILDCVFGWQGAMMMEGFQIK